MTIGSLIGPYRIIKKIGAGGMGQVFLAEHTLLGRRAAVKTLLPALSAHHEIIERFFNEARATSAISDPGVVQIYDFGYHVDGTAYIVMELLEGEPLSERIDRLGTLPLVDALRIVRQCAGSIAAAHARGIVHRDLKPENIFLIPDAEAQGGERPKILDFGIAKLTTTDAMTTQTGTMFGTPAYMSPEQCRGAGAIDQRSDVYAFGCLLFHMLTGRPPFWHEAPGEMLVAHLQEEPPRPSDFVPQLPPEVDAIALRCLAKSPDDRYPSMIELQAAVAQLELEVAIEAAPDLEAQIDAAIDAAPDITTVPPVRSPSVRVTRRPVLATPRPTPPIARWSEPDDEPPVVKPKRRGLKALLLTLMVLVEIAGVIAFVVSRSDHGHRAPEPAAEALTPVPAPGPDPLPLPEPAAIPETATAAAATPAPPPAIDPPPAATTETVAPRPQRVIAKKHALPQRQHVAPAPVPIKAKQVPPPSTEELYETR